MAKKPPLRIGFAGLPGVGKSTLARAFAAQCSSRRPCHVELVSEYAREHINATGSAGEITDQYLILQKQLHRENSVPPNTDIMITDSPIYLNFFYTVNLITKDQTKRESVMVSAIFEQLHDLNTPPRYDIIFYLTLKHNPVNDGVRKKEHLSKQWHLRMDTEVRYLFKLFPPHNFIEVSCSSLSSRTKFCVSRASELKLL